MFFVCLKVWAVTIFDCLREVERERDIYLGKWHSCISCFKEQSFGEVLL